MERVRLAAGTAAAMLGRVAHDLEEFGTVSPDWRLSGLLVPAALSVLYGARPGRASAWFLGGWLVLNLVGALTTVLPLGVWPWDPAQTVSHYAAHVVYAGGTLPLLWWLWRDAAATVSTGTA